MDPDAEFNLLTTLCQSVVHDMKHTYPGWEVLSQKAMKLGTQLKSTAQCLSSFVEAMQAVCDNANNLKGASRDVGACVTRVCIKQRAIENRMRSWADALCDELALSLQQRGAYWKSRCQELDKLGTKHVKRVRSRKQRPDITAMNEQREICSKVLTEQRTQFSFFIGTIMPVLNAQMNMLDEGGHLRQVVDNLESTVKHVNTDQLVSSIVADVAQGPDTAWKQCLAEAGQKWRSSEDGYSCMGSVRDLSTRATTPASSNFSSEDGMGTLTTNGALATSRSISSSCARMATNNPMESSASSVISGSTRFSNSKPPLQRRNSEKSIGQFSMSSPNTDGGGSSTYLNMLGTNGSSNTITEMTYQRAVNGGINGGTHHGPPPAYQQIMGQRNTGGPNIQRPQNLNFGYNGHAHQEATPTVNSPNMSSGSVASTSALLISEACKDIGQLGPDLENYCALNMMDQRYYIDSGVQKPQMVQQQHQPVTRRASSHAGDVQQPQVLDFAKRASINSNYGVPQVQGVRMRTTSASRPPPPARRSSHITAATPTAPSVAEQRMMAGSRQSLDSVGIYDNNQQQPQVQQYYQMSSFTKPTAQQQQQAAAAAKFRI